TVKLVLVGASSYNRVSVGAPLTVQLGIDNAAPVAQTVIRALTEVDYFGTVTTIMTGTVTVNAGQILTGTMTLATPNSGYFELQAALYDQTGTALSSSVAPFAVLRPQ